MPGERAARPVSDAMNACTKAAGHGPALPKPRTRGTMPGERGRTPQAAQDSADRWIQRAFPDWFNVQSSSRARSRFPHRWILRAHHRGARATSGICRRSLCRMPRGYAALRRARRTESLIRLGDHARPCSLVDAVARRHARPIDGNVEIAQQPPYRAAVRCGDALWQPSYFDHAVRHEDALRRHALYILGNPVRAGLATELDEYPFAWCRWPMRS